MSKITPENLPGHELIGLECTVVRATNPFLIGIKGKIIDETKNMIVIKNGKEKKIPKKEVVLKFMLDEPVEIEGKILIGRPEERVKIYGHRRRG
jgi:ribonuclease P protein subunit POP4